MPAAPEITDRDSLEAWLDALPRDTPEQEAEAKRIAVAIAFRAAMRVLPLAVPSFLTESARRRELTPQPVFRALLIAGAAGACQIPVIKDAAADAADAYAAAGDAAGAAAYPDAAAWRAVDGDCRALGNGSTLHLRPLSPNRTNPLAQQWTSAAESLTEAGPEWTFWIDWYEKCLAGAPQDWQGLLTDIALIPTDDWDKGPKHIAELIALLERKHDLLAELRAAKERLAATLSAGAGAAQRAHNNPP